MQQQPTDSSTPDDSSRRKLEAFNQDVLGYFLPAKFPESVAPGYLRFAGFCFTASIAGSAAMVLSTQTLLLAVGVVGSNTQHAGIMAGAFNWVMKDFVGQLGGVVFASQMGKTKAFDADPKRWRMVAAMALDGATLMEILSPLFPSALILPVASIANIGKNIGFLTASASRAALHQSIAISANLGDVTAKSGSQSIMASLIGTSLGIGMSSLLSHDTYNFAIGFCFLGIVHQGCNYLSVQSVRLTYFNRQRLHIVLEQYLKDGTVLSPEKVAKLESFFPLVSGDSGTKEWLSVGTTSLETLCPTPADLHEALVKHAGGEKDNDDNDNNNNHYSYLVKVTPDRHVHLMFFQDSSGEDMIRGMYHACRLRHDHRLPAGDEWTEKEQKGQATEHDFHTLLQRLHEQAWKTDTAVTSIECRNARRLAWNEPHNQPFGAGTPM
jgi:Vitamin B6 photo-protection and homoeostasis